MQVWKKYPKKYLRNNQEEESDNFDMCRGADPDKN